MNSHRQTALVAAAMLVASCDPVTHEVRYEVKGASSEALLTMITPTGTEQITTPLPWSRDMKVPSSQFLYLSVSNMGGGPVTCAIVRDGKTWTTTNGPTGHAICSGTAGGEPDPHATPAASPGAGPLTTAQPTTDQSPRSAWNYRQSTDAMTDQVTQHACVRSQEPVHLGWPYGSPYAELCLRNSPRMGKDAYVSLIGDGQILCRSYESCTVSVRFDSGPVQRFSAIGPSDGSSDVFFIQNRSRFEAALRKADRVIIEAEFYEAGNQQMIFHTTGLDFPQPKAAG